MNSKKIKSSTFSPAFLRVTVIILTLIVSVTPILLIACEKSDSDGEISALSSEKIPAVEIGEGRMTFRLEVTDDTGTIKAWNVNTDLSIVGDALLEVGLISGDVSSYGLMVTEVNGLASDFMANESWWAFYIGGEFAMTGVDSTDVEFGKVYSFVYTIG